MLAARKAIILASGLLVLPDLATDHSEQYDKWYDFFNSIAVDQPLEEFPKFTHFKRKKLYYIKKTFGRIFKYQK